MLCTRYQKNSLLHLGAVRVLEPAKPLPRGLQELFVLQERLLVCGRHPSLSYQCLSKQIIMAQ